MADKFDAAIFFDNDQGYLDTVKEKCPGITLVKVNETYPLKKSSLNSGPFKEFIDTLGKNSYVEFLKHYKDFIPSYDPDSGIQKADIDKYYDWEKNTTGNRILLLDWDLTMIMFEGMELPYLINDKNYNFFHQSFIQLKDVAIVYFGGEERFYMIQNWLKDVAKSGVHIGILTNNGACKEKLFHKIVAEIMPKGSNYEMMCSRFAPYNGNKGRFLFDDPRFDGFCSKHIGGKRKTRRRRRQSRKNRLR
jgi:hypothetical protein